MPTFRRAWHRTVLQVLFLLAALGLVAFWWLSSCFMCRVWPFN